MPERPDGITVRYWAGARAAAGVPTDVVPTDEPLSLADVRELAAALHPGTRLPEVLKACSVLIGDEPVGRRDPRTVTVRPGDSVEFLPPFAGG